MEFPLSLCEPHRNKIGKKDFSFLELQLANGKVRHFADSNFGLGMREMKLYRYFRNQSILLRMVKLILSFFDRHIYHGVILIAKTITCVSGQVQATTLTHETKTTKVYGRGLSRFNAWNDSDHGLKILLRGML